MVRSHQLLQWPVLEKLANLLALPFPFATKCSVLRLNVSLPICTLLAGRVEQNSVSTYLSLCRVVPPIDTCWAADSICTRSVLSKRTPTEGPTSNNYTVLGRCHPQPNRWYEMARVQMLELCAPLRFRACLAMCCWRWASCSKFTRALNHRSIKLNRKLRKHIQHSPGLIQGGMVWAWDRLVDSRGDHSKQQPCRQTHLTVQTDRSQLERHDA